MAGAQVNMLPILELAFFDAHAEEGTKALAQAREAYSQIYGPDRFNYELVMPPQPDTSWLEGVLRRLVYVCDSMDLPIPDCPGVLVSIFHGDRLSCLAAKVLLEQSASILDLSVNDLAQVFGTHESHSTPAH